MLKTFQLATEDPAYNSVFAHGISVQEVNTDTRMTSAVSSLLEISRDVYHEISINDYNFEKSILPEYLDYYSTAMLWIRILRLKRFSYTFTETEEMLMSIIHGDTFCIPEPILVQLKILGKIQTLTGQHLTPEFPPLPDNIVNGYGGFYGPINQDNHNIYEEIPCLGVLSEAVRYSVSEAPAGRYISSLERVDDNIIPTDNLLGYRPLGFRRNEAKNLAFDAGINANDFPSSVPDVGINLKFLRSISTVLARTKTFKNTTLNILSMPESGSTVQAIMQRACIGTAALQKRGEIFSFGSFNEQDSAYGLGVVFTPNLYKEGSTPEQVLEWSCITHPPDEWIVNRNIRRTLIPLDYRREVFRSLAQYGQVYRRNFVRHLVTTTR